MLSLIGAAMVLQLWHADLGVPFWGGGDAFFFQMLVKSTVDNGWVLTNPYLGAPFGQELQDYPVAGADALHVIAVRVLGLFFTSPAVVVNAYFLLSFPLAAVTAFAVLRWLRLSGPVAVAGAVLFALAPYHFLRGEWHLFLAAYFTVPLGAYLVLALYLGQPLFGRRERAGPRLLRYATPRTLLTLAVCAAVGLSDLYYATFTVLLVAAAILITALARRRRATLVSGGVVAVVLIVVTALALAPNLLYRIDHGANPVLDRAPDESEAFSLNLTELIMPVPGHRIEALSDVRRRFSDASRVGGEPAPLGLLSGLGFLALLLAAAALCLGAAERLTSDPRLRALATANLTAFLIGTTGGVSAAIAYALTPQLRTWSRLSIFIAFFALAALGLGADAARARLRSRSPRAGALASGALAAVVLLAVLDQTSGSFTPPYDQARAEYRSDEAFVRGIEERMDPGAAILQLPYMRFPDQHQLAAMQDYDPVRGYLHSRDLHWSYGAMRGRPEDWQAETVNMPVSIVLPMVAAAGFAGVWIDRLGYRDGGATEEAELRRLSGTVPLVSRNGRLAFYDVRGYARRLRATVGGAELDALAEATLRPPRTIWSKDDFYAEERVGARTVRWAVRRRSRLEVVNPSPETRTVVFVVTLARPGGAPASTVFRFPDGGVQRVRVQPAGTPVLRRVPLPPGTSSIEVVTQGKPVARAGDEAAFRYVQLLGFQLLPEPALAVARRPLS